MPSFAKTTLPLQCQGENLSTKKDITILLQFTQLIFIFNKALSCYIAVTHIIQEIVFDYLTQ